MELENIAHNQTNCWNKNYALLDCNIYAFFIRIKGKSDAKFDSVCNIGIPYFSFFSFFQMHWREGRKKGEAGSKQLPNYFSLKVKLNPFVFA